MHTLQVHQMGAVLQSRMVKASLQTLLRMAAQSLCTPQIGLVVVCDANGVLAGVISKTDVVRQMGHCAGGACRALVQDLMTKEVTTCRPTDLLQGVLATMQARGLVHLPVLDADDRPVGVVNARDALRVMVSRGNFEQSQLFDYVMGVGYH